MTHEQPATQSPPHTHAAPALPREHRRQSRGRCQRLGALTERRGKCKCLPMNAEASNPAEKGAGPGPPRSLPASSCVSQAHTRAHTPSAGRSSHCWEDCSRKSRRSERKQSPQPMAVTPEWSGDAVAAAHPGNPHASRGWEGHGLGTVRSQTPARPHRHTHTPDRPYTPAGRGGGTDTHAQAHL